MNTQREYEYRATDTAGRICSGSLSAPSREAAGEELRRRGLQVVSLSERTGSPSREALHGRVALEEFVQFNSLLGSMVKSGLPLDQSLRSIAQDIQSPRMKSVIESVQAEVEGGSSLSAALRKRGDCFADLYISLVEAGETSGHLGTVLLKVARQSRLHLHVRRRITEAMFYPSILALAAVAAAIFLSLGVTPGFAAMYQDMGIALPWLTQAMLTLFSASVMIPLGTVVVVGLIVLWTMGRRSSVLQRLFDAVAPLLPVLSRLLSAFGLSRFCSALSALLRAGVPLPSALTIVARTSTSARLRHAVDTVCQSVAEGRSLSESLRQYPPRTFPRILCWMVSLGEHQGNLPDMLEQAGDLYDNQTERYAAVLDMLLVPAVVLVSGAMVVLFVVAALSPLFVLLEHLGA